MLLESHNDKRKRGMKEMSRLKSLDCFLRASSIPLTTAAIWLTATNHQDNLSFGRIQFSNFLPLKYMVCISGISAAYALASASASWVDAVAAKTWLFFVADQIVAYLMVTSAAAIADLLYLSYNGDRDVTWSDACSSYAAFCHKMRLALILHSVALLWFFALAIISAYRTFRDFDPPYVPTKEAEEE